MESNNLKSKIGKNNQKIERYSIKKFKLGAASVVVGVGVYFAGGVAYAEETQAASEVVSSTRDDAEIQKAPNVQSEAEKLNVEPSEGKKDVATKDDSTSGDDNRETEEKQSGNVLRSATAANESESSPKELEKSNSVVRMNIDRLTEKELYAGEMFNAKFRLEVEHGGAPLMGVSLKYEVVSKQYLSYREMTISDFSGNKAEGYYGEYTQKIGTITPGTKIEIPFSARISSMQDGMEDKEYTLKITATDERGNVLGVAEENVINKMKKVLVPDVNFEKSTAGGDPSNEVVVGYKKDGKVAGRAIVDYRLNYPQEYIDAYRGVTNGEVVDYGVRVRFDEQNFEYMYTGRLNSSLQLTRNHDGYLYIPRGMMLNDKLSLVYIGDSLEVPDTNITFELVNFKGNGEYVVVDGSKKTVVTHKNILEDVKNPEGIISVNNILNIESSTEGKQGGNGESITHPSVEINGDQVSAYNDGDSVRAKQDIEISGTSNDIVTDLKTIDIDFAKLSNGRDKFETLTRFAYRLNVTGQLAPEDKVYLVKNDGSKVDLPNLFEGSIRDLSAPVDIKDSKGIRIEFEKTRHLTKDVVVYVDLVLEDTTTKKEDVLSSYKFDDSGKKLAPTDPNQYNFTVKVNDDSTLWYSPYGALVKKGKTAYVVTDFTTEAKYVGGQSRLHSETDRKSIGKGDKLENIHPIVILPTGMEITESKDGDYKKRELERIVPLESGYTMYIYKPNAGDIYYLKAPENNVDFNVTEAGVRNATSNVFTFYGYSGAIIEGDSEVLVKSSHSSVDDVAKDPITKEILNKNIFKDPVFVLAKAPQSVTIPKGVSIYDRSSKTDVEYRHDSTGVEKGSIAYIRPTIKNLSGEAYKDIRVVTVLSHVGDDSFDGTLKRTSQFTPVLRDGSVVVPVGWKGYATNEEQKDATNANTLGGWMPLADVKDWTKVKALKWESNSDFILADGDAVDFGYAIDVPKDAKYGAKITTTSAIATNGSNNFLEGYRSTVRVVEKYEKVTVNYEDEDGNVIKAPVVEDVLVESDYSTWKYRLPEIHYGADKYNYYKLKEGSSADVGVIEEGKPVNITYVYTKDRFEVESVRANLVVRYVKEGADLTKYEDDLLWSSSYYFLGEERYKVSSDGKKVLIKDETKEVDYQTSALERYVRDGDSYLLVKTPANASGKLSKKDLRNGEYEVIYVYREELEESVDREAVERKIFYRDRDFNMLEGVSDFEDKVTFNYKTKRNAYSKIIKEDNGWVADTTNVLKGNKLPYVTGYIAVEGIEDSQKDKGVSATDIDITEWVLYDKLGAWVAEIPNVDEKDYPKITYPNHPTDPTKLGEVKEGILPYVEGYVAKFGGVELVEVKDANGNVIGYNAPAIPEEFFKDTHVKYEKIQTPVSEVTTSYVDEELNPIAPQEKGKKEAKVIAGYVYERTEEDEKGNTTHIYKKEISPIVEVTTSYVDEELNPIAPQEKGKKEAKVIAGYVYERTEEDEKGNTTHIYKKEMNRRPDVRPIVSKRDEKVEVSSVQKKQLPKTTVNTATNATTMGVLGMLMAVAIKRRRKNK